MKENGPFREEILRLAGEAISYRSCAGNPDETAACLELFLNYLKSPHIVIRQREFEGVPSAVIMPREVKKPEVIICGHIDVVPGDDSQFNPLIEEDRLYGRGAMDMKGNLAAVAAVFKKTSADSPPWWLIIVSDEETGGNNGAARLAEEGLAAKLFMVAEPSELELALQSKGALRLEIVHHGKKAHASTPWLGISSVEQMMKIQPLIREVIPDYSKEAWETTASLSLIWGGTVINQVPDDCRLCLDIRYIPGDDPDRITAAMKKKLDGFEVNVLDVYPPMVCREDAPMLLSLKETFREVCGTEPVIGRQHGATDARYFAGRMDALIFGAAGQNLHGADEWVSIESLMTFARIMELWGESLRVIETR